MTPIECYTHPFFSCCPPPPTKPQSALNCCTVQQDFLCFSLSASWGVNLRFSRTRYSIPDLLVQEAFLISSSSQWVNHTVVYQTAALELSITLFTVFAEAACQFFPLEPFAPFHSTANVHLSLNISQEMTALVFTIALAITHDTNFRVSQKNNQLP